MPAVPIKFRCYRCSQLLGVAPSKAGAVVACPKCSAELVVPEPDEPAEIPASQVPSFDAGLSASHETDSLVDSGVSLELLDIRPEDIRVQPGIAASPPVSAAQEAVAAGVASAAPAVVHVAPPFPPTSPAPPPLPPSAPPLVPSEPFTAAASRAEEPPALSSIQVDTNSRPVPVRRASPPVRASDLVLPRSIVAAWSLFVILALGLAFVAGLLAGHYVWRVH